LRSNLYAGQSESYTQQNGLVMAQAIKHALAPNSFTVGTHDPDGEDGLNQIMGHSHGLEGGDDRRAGTSESRRARRPVTLLESPEDGPYYNPISSSKTAYNTALAGFGGAQNFNVYLDQMNISRTPVTGRTSTDSTFVDNYYSTRVSARRWAGSDLTTNFGSVPGAKNELSKSWTSSLIRRSSTGSSPCAETRAQSERFSNLMDILPLVRPNGRRSQNGINWSPLIDASAPSGLANSYQQTVLQSERLFHGGRPHGVVYQEAAGVVAGMR